ncbi:hypothetical protein Celaphus_00004803, partial [Cervus elaphus hippelaphus]
MRLLLLLLPLVLWGAPLAQRLELRQNVIVQEGLCVLLPCTFPHPWVSFGKIYMFWFREGADTKHDPLVATNKPVQKLHEGTQGRFSLPREPQARNCSLSITDVNAGDSGTYFFRAETHFRKFPYLNKMFFLNVTALTHQPHVLSPGALEAGRPGNLTCSVPWACERATPPVFSWTASVDIAGGERCQLCPAHLSVSLPFSSPEALKILQNTSSLPVQEGQVLRLLCAADSNPPAQLSWFRGSPALEVTAISSTGVLELPRVGAAEEEVFTCQAQNPLGSQNISLSLSVVSPPPQLLGPSCSQKDEGLCCSCSSRARPAASLCWRLGEGLLEGNFSNASFKVNSSSTRPWANSSLSLREGLSSGLSSGLSLNYEALNVHRAQSKPQPRAGKVLGAVGGASVTVLLSLCLYLLFRVKTHRKTQPVQSMDDTNHAVGSGSRSPVPEILGNATSLRVREGQSLRLVCVVDSNPPANVSWARGSPTLSPSQPLDPAVLELPQVVLGDGGAVTCKAQHPSGSDRVCLLFLPPRLWRESWLLAPGPHPAEGGPGGGWFPPYLWPLLDLLHQ